jgi:hypothetical protein
VSGSRVTVFGRPGCHLCESLVEELYPLCRALGFSLGVVDVDADPASRDRYGLRIPVACLDGEELTGWPLNREHVVRMLSAHLGHHSDPTGQTHGGKSP